MFFIEDCPVPEKRGISILWSLVRECVSKGQAVYFYSGYW